MLAARHRHHARHRRAGRWCCCPRCARTGFRWRSALGPARTPAAARPGRSALGDRLRRWSARSAYLVATRSANGGRTTGGSASTAFANASLLFQMPYGIIGVALLTALLPRMSRAAARRRRGRRACRPLAGHPAVGAGAAAGHRRAHRAGPGAGHGRLRPRQHRRAARPARSATALAVGAFGLLPMAITLLQLRVFYAMKDARTPDAHPARHGRRPGGAARCSRRWCWPTGTWSPG